MCPRSGLGNILNDPNGILAVLACPSLKTIDSVLHWYTMSDLDTENDCPTVRKMQFFWGEILWDLGRTDTSIFTGIIAFTLWKRQALLCDGYSSASNLQEIRLAELMSMNIFRKRTLTQMRSGRTLVCMGGFALMGLLNGDREQSLIHLRAMASIFPILQPDEHEWLLTSWVDLRIASSGSHPPLLPHYIPQYWLDHELREPSELSVLIDHNASLNVRLLGTLAGDTLSSAFNIFRNLHKSTYLLENSLLTETLPYAVLFDMIYEICSMDDDSLADGPQACRALVLTALKLTGWRTAARYVT